MGCEEPACRMVPAADMQGSLAGAPGPASLD